MTRPKILFAWELGANFGHVSKIGEIAKELTEDFDVTIAARHPIAVRRLYPDLQVTLLPAPYQPTRNLAADEGMGQCYPGVLRTEGWDSAGNLIPLMEAWRSLFDLTKPDILVSQAAPTALLAARGLPLKTVMLGSGYDTPPRTSPMQVFLRGNEAAEAEAGLQESEALGVANTALDHFDAPSMSQFSDLLDTDLTLLVAYPELDHHSWRAEVQPDHPPYLGQIFTTQSGQDVDWRNRGAPRIFAYLRPDARHFKEAMQALNQIGPNHDIILASPGIHPTLREKLEKRMVLVVDGAVRLDKLLSTCNLGINTGSNGIVSAFLHAGVPQLCIPGHREQMMCSAALANAGVGLGIAGKFGPNEVIGAISQALGSAALKNHAEQARDRIIQNGLDRPVEAATKLIRGLF